MQNGKKLIKMQKYIKISFTNKQKKLIDRKKKPKNLTKFIDKIN